MARFGLNVSFTDESKKLKVDHANVMPNHLALADRFTISDNFYVDSDVSADGHVWLTNTYPNQWMETHHPAAYGGQRNFKAASKAPGKFGMTDLPEQFFQRATMKPVPCGSPFQKWQGVFTILDLE